LMVDDLKEAKDLKVVADISCDIAGPIPCTIRPSTIADPIYGYNARNQSETNWANDEAICVMAVDNLPCELPKEASEDFGIQLVKNVMPHLLGEDVQGVIERGSETTVGGTLSENYWEQKSH
jgi:saccharopine dehydrogenase (NAD+, L-lysine-forming)